MRKRRLTLTYRAVLFLMFMMERRIMAKIDDAVDQMAAAIDGLDKAVADEIQQLKDAIAAGNAGNADAAADRVLELVARVNSDVQGLTSDDPAPAPAPEPTPEPQA